MKGTLAVGAAAKMTMVITLSHQTRMAVITAVPQERLDAK
jgi:hypothetical protein